MALALVCTALAWFAAPAMAADPAAVSESKAQALFLANFVKYVDWPDDAFATTNTPVVIGLVGDCDVKPDLQALAKTTLVAGRPLTVRSLKADDDSKGCHIVFLPNGESPRMSAVLERLRGTPTLTVGDCDKFSAAGGMITLRRRESRIRPQVNLAAVERENLKLSSKLLAVSDVRRDTATAAPLAKP